MRFYRRHTLQRIGKINGNTNSLEMMEVEVSPTPSTADYIKLCILPDALLHKRTYGGWQDNLNKTPYNVHL